ncbi:MAG: outer membrane beta-barrel protein [Methylobacteriaceae bacterium]|nr:outer membrane beta-barrel protein [Methylobacteriaceae bacterium]
MPAALLAAAAAAQTVFAQDAGSTLRVIDSPSPLTIAPPSTTSGSGLSGLPPARGIEELRRTANPFAPGSEPTPQQTFGQSPFTTAPNYGRPRQNLILGPIKPRPAPRPSARQLPPLEAYKGSKIARDLLKRGIRVTDPNALPDTTGGPPKVFDPTLGMPAPSDAPPTVAVLPTLPIRVRPKVDETPFAATGVEVANVRFRPTLDAYAGYDSNPFRIEAPTRGSTELRTDGAVNIQSEWSRHELKGDLRLGYADFIQVPKANRPDGAGTLTGRIDVTRDTQIDLGARYALTTQRPGSPELPAGTAGTTVTNQPIVFSSGATLGATQRFNRLELSLKGTFDRTVNQNATQSDGTIIDLAANNFNAYGLTGRAAYEISPKLKPFVEVTADMRRYDQQLDQNGFERSSNGISARGGATYQVTSLISGEASAGYGQRKYEDPRLSNLNGPLVDASLIYTPTPLTKVTLRGTTAFEETNVANASGAIVRRLTLEISHSLLRNVTLSALGTFQDTQYRGVTLDEKYFAGTLRAEYNLTRTVAVRASYTFEKLKSTTPGSDYTANVFLLGLRLQR